MLALIQTNWENKFCLVKNYMNLKIKINYNITLWNYKRQKLIIKILVKI
jgi:hypothetical protein